MISLYIHIPFCIRKCNYCDFLSGPASAEMTENYLDALKTEIALTGDMLSGKKAPAAELKAAGIFAGINDHDGTPGKSLSKADGVRGTKSTDVDSIFIGGGTPSILTEGQMYGVLNCVRDHYHVLPDAEITAEANPGTVSKEKLCSWIASGINRISIGVQSFHDAELRMLGRIHNSKEAVEAYENARTAGFDNISIDLMSALPGQTFSAWERNLQKAVELAPDHISAYSLILEDGTPLSREYENGCLPPVPEDEEDRRMYHFTRDFLGAHGYRQYEISNYAKDGKRCRHNIGYWTGHDYLGLGLGASSLLQHIRFSNTTDMEHYLQKLQKAHIQPEEADSLPRKECSQTEEDNCLLEEENSLEEKDDCLLEEENSLEEEDNCFPEEEYCLTEYENVQILTKKEQMAEFMFLGLRMTEGVSEKEFLRRFGTSLFDIYGEEISRHMTNGLLHKSNGRVFLTSRGIDICNYVMCDFL